MSNHPPDLVGRSEIAEHLGVSIKTIDSWRSRPPVVPMPEPERFISGTPVWRWADVEAWARENGRGKYGDE